MLVLVHQVSVIAENKSVFMKHPRCIYLSVGIAA